MNLDDRVDSCRARTAAQREQVTRTVERSRVARHRAEELRQQAHDRLEIAVRHRHQAG